MLTLAGLFWEGGNQFKKRKNSPRMSQESNNPYKPTTPRANNRKEKRKSFTLMNMQIYHRGVGACLKNRCFCFQQLIVQTTARSRAPSVRLPRFVRLSHVLYEYDNGVHENLSSAP